MKYFIIVALTLLTSCAQQRFNRLIRKHPELVQTDTITRIDTVEVFIPKISHDTAFLETHLYDTVEIQKERLKIKIWRVNDTVRVHGECDSITVTEYIETKIPVRYYEKSNFWDKIKGYLFLFIILAGIITIIFYEKKRRENG